MTGSEPAQRAALGVALLLWLLAAGPHFEAEALCTRPAEVESLAGWSVAVRCDGLPSRSASARDATPTRPSLRGPSLLLFGHPLDLNTADARELEVLPGIGPSRASAIVEARPDRGYRSLAQLTSVSGIGPVTVAGLRGLLRADAEGAGGDFRW